MAFQHPQQRRTRHVPLREDSSPLLDDSGELCTSVDSEVLVFGGQTTNALRLSSATVPSSSTIDQSWHLLHNRTQSATSSTHRSSSISTTSSSRDGHQAGGPPLASPASLTHSLFPSHDGGGIFIAGSLVQSADEGTGGSATGATYATEEEEEDLDSSQPSGSSALSDTSSSSFSRAGARGRHVGLHAPPGGSTIGGSWALTEEALSTVPHATPLGGAGAAHLHGNGSGTADFTESSSDDESLEGIVVGRRRTLTRRVGGEKDDDDEVLLSATPHAVSAGMLSEAGGREGRGGMYDKRYDGKEDDESSRSRESYPSPPPEDRSRIRIKRRHRQSGRNGGSQKRSSASGSIAGAEAAVVASPLLLGAGKSKSSRRSQDVVAQQLEEDKLRRLQAEKDVLLGGVASRLMEIDTSTLELVATVRAPPTPEATPTPSRSTSPTPHLVTPRQLSRKAAHGIQALAQHARDELGDSAMFSVSADEEEEEEDDSGEETETEMDHSPKLIQKQWHTSPSPPIFAPRRAAAPSSSSPLRTLSASSLPLYLSDALAPLTHTNLINSTCSLKAPLIRRTSSLSSSGAVLPGGEENPWGGEFEGFEAAMSYWRRLLRRMRGL